MQVVSQSFTEIKEMLSGPRRAIKADKEWVVTADTIRGLWEESCPINRSHTYVGSWKNASLSVNGRIFHITLEQLHLGMEHADELPSITENTDLKVLTSERAHQIAKQVLGMGPTSEEIEWVRNHAIYKYLFTKYLSNSPELELSPNNPTLQIIRVRLPNSDKYYSIINFTPYDFYFDNYKVQNSSAAAATGQPPFGCELKQGNKPIYWNNGRLFRPTLTSNVEEAGIIYQDESGQLKLISCGEKEFKEGRGDAVFDLRTPQSDFTILDAKYNAGFGNQLFIRGASSEQLSWERGIKGVCIAPDRWRFTLLKLYNNAEYKILRNDNDYEEGPNHSLNLSQPWKTVTPHFN